MRRVRYGVASSLDGFIAGPGGQADWIRIDPELDFEAMLRQFDTLLIGRRTFEAMMAAGNAGPLPGIRTVVFSTSLAQADHPRITIVSRDAGDFVADFRRQPGKDIALFGGGSLFRSLLDAGQVDTVEVSLIPVLLGAGIPILPPTFGEVALELTAHRVLKATGTLSLEYRIRREPQPRLDGGGNAQKEAKF